MHPPMPRMLWQLFLTLCLLGLGGGSCGLTQQVTNVPIGTRQGPGLLVTTRVPVSATADGPRATALQSPHLSTQAIRPGFDDVELPANDDGSTGVVALGFPINFYGTSFDQLYVNNNGNITFDAAQWEYTPYDLTSTQRKIIAPFFADIDTRAPGSARVRYSYGLGQVDGRPAFGVNWVNVGYYNSHDDKLNSIQLILIDRSDIAPGDFDFEFNYDRIEWETGDASGGVNGLGGASARAGFSNGTGISGTFFELPGSAVNGGLLDTNRQTGLINNSLNSSLLGRYVFQVRNGGVQAADVQVTKTATPESVYEYQQVTYTLTVTNNGPIPSDGVVLTDQLPAGMIPVTATATRGEPTLESGGLTLDLGELAVGETVVVTLVVRAEDPAASRDRTNTATVTTTTPDPNAHNNMASVTTRVVFPIDYAPVQVDALRIIEGDTGEQMLAMTATFSPIWLEAGYTSVTARLVTVEASAVAGEDYGALDTLLTLTAAVPSRTISIPIYGDRRQEADETFQVAVAPQQGLGAAATVTILNDDQNVPPIARDDAYQVRGNRDLYVGSLAGVLTNDSDENGDTLTVTLVSGPTAGLLLLNPDGSFLYSPPSEWTGMSEAIYEVFDGWTTATATIVFTVTPIIHVRTDGNDAADGLSWAQAKQTIAAGLLAVGTDGEIWVAEGQYQERLTITGISVILLGGFVGDELLASARDWRAHPTVLVPVAKVQIDQAPSVSLDGFVIRGGQNGAISCDNSTLAVHECRIEDNGPSFYGGGLDLLTSQVSITGCTFTRNEGIFGGAICSWASDLEMTSTVLTENVADFGAGLYTFSGSAWMRNLTVANNHAQGMGGGIHVQRTNAELANSIVAFNSSGLLAVSCTPVLKINDVYGNNGFDYFGLLPGIHDLSVDPLLDGTYHLQLTSPCLDSGDGILIGDQETDVDGEPRVMGDAVDLGADEVRPNSAPVAVADRYAIDEDVTLRVEVGTPGVLGNDSDPEGDAMRAFLETGVAHGALSFVGDGSFVYVPETNWHGTDSFTYFVSDGALNSAPVTVTLAVRSINDPPVATGETYTIRVNRLLTVVVPGVLANDADVEGDPLTALLVSGPDRGALTLAATGGFTYQPTAGFAGLDRFIYRASDGQATSANVTVTIAVEGVFQPDAIIRGHGADDAWYGDGLYNEVSVQTLTTTTRPGTPVVFDVLVQNDRDAELPRVSGPASVDGWAVSYWREGQEIPAAQFVAGWTPASMPVYLEVRVTPGPNVVGGARVSVPITATSVEDTTKSDTVVMACVLESPPAEVIVDNADATGVAITGRWFASATAPGYWGRNYLYDDLTQKGATSVRFTPSLPASGLYTVYLRWRSSATNLAANVPVVVTHRDGTQTLSVNQQQNGGTWYPLGTFNFLGGSSGNVLLRTTGTQGYVIADAVRFVPVASVLVVVPNGGESWQMGSVQPITWSAINVSGNVRLELLKGATMVRTLAPTVPVVQGSFAWTLPADLVAGDDYRVRITSTTESTLTDQSDAPFTITAAARELILDNTDPTGVTRVGTWTASSAAPGYWGTNYLYDSPNERGTSSVTFTPTMAAAGLYTVYLRWRVPATTLAANVPVDIVHALGTSTTVVNQRLEGGDWVLLGTFRFTAGTTGRVTIRTTGVNGMVIADAVRFLPATAADVIVDNLGSGVTKTGSWFASSTAPGYYGADYLYDNLTQKGTTSVRFTPILPTNGRYVVYLRWRSSAASLAPNVPIDITHLAGMSTVTVNQQLGGGTWVPLGTFDFAAGSAGNVLLRTTGTSPNLYAIADAVRFVQVP
jgi:uncharacterized repeat protein (TIGR01451 family)